MVEEPRNYHSLHFKPNRFTSPCGRSRSIPQGRLGVGPKTKRQIEVTMFAVGVRTLDGLKVGKLLELQSKMDLQKALEYVLEKNKGLHKSLA